MAVGDIEIGPLAGEEEQAAYAALLEHAFAPNPTGTPDVGWMGRQGPEHFRVARVGGRVVGGLGLLPVGQWFGGRSVPAVGLDAVVVAPERRGGGVGSRLVGAALAEAQARGWALAVLYPSSQPVYRRAGWEQAGHCVRYRVPVHALPTGERGLTVRPVEDGEEGVLRTLYARRAAATAGNLDRSDAVWWFRLREGNAISRYLAERDGEPEGYVVYTQGQAPGERERRIAVRDLVAVTPAAGRRLLGFLAAHRGVADDVEWYGPPADPLLLHLTDQEETVTRTNRWLLRLVDVRAALAARGYPAGVEAEVNLEVRDETLPGNAGRLTLRVAEGRGEVHEGGAGRVRVEARGLGPLYSGYLPPADLRAAGLLDGPDGDLAALAAVFAGPAPWMPDRF